jgi:mono/diheme cytochrome c family protein
VTRAFPAAIALAAAVACAGRPASVHRAPMSPAAAGEKEAFARAKPVLDAHCAKCHTSAGKEATPKKLARVNMDTYPFRGRRAADIGAAIRKVLGVDGGKPTMPRDEPGAVKGKELEAVVAWTRAYDKAHPAGAPR